MKPSNATGKAVTWKSSNTKIATVSKTGKVTAVKPGTATITATTANGKKAACKITVKGISIAKAKVTLKKTAMTYTGKALKPGVKAVKLGSKTLKAGTDYKVSYKNNIKAGKKATVIITGKGKYTGTVKKTFTIKRKQPMTVKAAAKTVKLKKVKKKAQIVSGAITFKKKAQGKVTYTKVAKGSAKVLTINKKTGKITVKKGTKKGTYKIKVKVAAAGNANYAAGSKIVTVTVKVK